MTLNVVEFPKTHTEDIVTALRNLADSISNGDIKPPHALAWIADCGNKEYEFGLMGNSVSPGTEFHLLMHVGMTKIVNGVV